MNISLKTIDPNNYRELINLLKNSNKLYYLPNSGNAGDSFIASATFSFFDKIKINYKQLYSFDEFENGTLIYGGGGAWIDLWEKYLNNVLNIMKKADRVIILPSSFNNITLLPEILEKKFYVFCREKKSFNYLKSFNSEANIFLCPDMAFSFGNIPSSTKCSDIELINKINCLNDISSKFCNKETISLFRNDEEKKYGFKSDFDLSNAFGWVSPFLNKATYDIISYEFLKFINQFNEIKSDRLHVCICSAMLGKKTYMYDNSYGKNFSVFSYTLNKYNNVKFIK